jgi:hypothetical protein
MSWSTLASCSVAPLAFRLRTFELVPSARLPSTAHHVGAICRVHYPDCLTALDATPGRRCFWCETVPTGLAVTFSDADIRLRGGVSAGAGSGAVPDVSHPGRSDRGDLVTASVRATNQPSVAPRRECTTRLTGLY